MAPFLDTNVLVYTWSDDARADTAQAIVTRPFVTGVQVMNEFVVVLRRKLALDWETIEQAVADVVEGANALVPLTLDMHVQALRLAERHGVHFYDAIVIATALRAGCETLLSEDMHDGLVIENVLTIRNPFIGS